MVMLFKSLQILGIRSLQVLERNVVSIERQSSVTTTAFIVLNSFIPDPRYKSSNATNCKNHHLVYKKLSCNDTCEKDYRSVSRNRDSHMAFAASTTHAAI